MPQNNKTGENYPMLLKKITVGICASVFTIGLASAADMSGKTVEWTIPFSETGGSAKWANFFAPLLSEALPGNPTVVVKYMPGDKHRHNHSFSSSCC